MQTLEFTFVLKDSLIWNIFSYLLRQKKITILLMLKNAALILIASLLALYAIHYRLIKSRTVRVKKENDRTLDRDSNVYST